MIKRVNRNNYFTKIPNDRMERMNEILWDRQVLSVYCDGSMIQHHPIIGVGCCYVGNGFTWIESKKLYIKYVDRSLYTELKAVVFGIVSLPSVITKHEMFLKDLSSISVYSDYNLIASLLEDYSGNDDSIKEALEEIKINKERVEAGLGFKISLSYLGEEKKSNIFHKSAHNAARKVIGKK